MEPQLLAGVLIDHLVLALGQHPLGGGSGGVLERLEQLMLNSNHTGGGN